MSRCNGTTASVARLVLPTLLLPLLAATLGGCSGEAVTGTLAGGGGRLVIGGLNGGTTGIASALVGRWFRLVYFPDSAGSVRTSETTLDLRRDGTLVRVVVARDLAFNFADAVVSSGTWRADATTLTLTITSVGTGAAPIDTLGTGSVSGPIVGNPSFGSPPPITGGTTTSDTLGTSTGSVRYTYRIETSSQGRTLFINDTPFVAVVGAP